jgi:aminobenzoyl-glutamate utilization protein B
MNRFLIPLLLVAICLAFTPPENIADQPAAKSIDDDVVKHLDSLRGELIDVNQDIWTYAEVGLEEHRSSKRLVDVLKKAGFKVKEGVADMPTAFVAEYGSGSPVIGILAEYDALPELSQEVAGTRKPAAGRSTGTAAGIAPSAPERSGRPLRSSTFTTSTNSRGPSASTARRPRKR